MWDIVGAVSMAVTATVIAVGFCYARRQLASTRNARVAQVFTDIASRWDSKEMEESRRLLNLKGDANDVAKAIQEADNNNDLELWLLTRPANFWDDVGMLVTEGFIDCSIAYDLFSSTEEHYYKLYSKLLEEPQYQKALKCFIELHDVFQKEATRRKLPKPRRWPRRRP